MDCEIGNTISCGVVGVFSLSICQDRHAKILTPAQALVDALRNRCVPVPGWRNPPLTEEQERHYRLNVPCRNVFIWSDYDFDDRPNYGRALMDSILKEGLGTVTETGPHINGNTRHNIFLYTFIPNRQFHEAIGWKIIEHAVFEQPPPEYDDWDEPDPNTSDDSPDEEF